MTKAAKRNTLWMPLFLIILSVLIISGYWYLDKRPAGQETGTATEAQTLLEKDLEHFYPATPRSVVLLYCRIVKCIYAEELTEEETKALAAMEQRLFDEELLAINPFDSFYMELCTERRDFKERGNSFIGYQVDRASNVKTWKQDGAEYASIVAYYSTRNNGETGADYKEFLLRKDEENRWKILGWRETAKQELETE